MTRAKPARAAEVKADEDGDELLKRDHFTPQVDCTQPRTKPFLDRYARSGDAHFIDAICALASFHAFAIAVRERIEAGEPLQASIAIVLRDLFRTPRSAGILKLLMAMLGDSGVNVAEYLETPRRPASP